MIKSLLLIIMIASGGFWSSGEEGRISLTWAVADQPMPASILSWQLLLADVELASGSREMAAGENEIRMKLPETRVTTTLQWRYQLKRKDNQQILQSGTLPIYVLAPRPLAQKARLFAGKKIMVIDAADQLPAVLAQNGIAHQQVSDFQILDLASPDYVLVGENQLPANPLMAHILLRQARRGAGIVVFMQNQQEQLIGQKTVLRAFGQPLEIKQKHFLPEPMTQVDLGAWISAQSNDIRAIRTRKNDNAIPLVFFTTETPDEAHVDSAIVSLPMDQGRIVLCQLPVQSWRQDLRSQLLLAGILDYLVTPTEQTKSDQTPPTPGKPANIYPKGDAQ